MTGIPQNTQPEQEKRIIVISDLHMTAGCNPETGVWSPTEDFFLDDEFKRFLHHYSRGPATTLVINGDLLDFLQVLEFPDEWKTDRGKGKQKNHVYEIEREWCGGTFNYSIPLADINPKYGLRCTREATEFLAGKIVEGHEQFFRALVHFAARDGNSVVILKGNHDIQLFWGRVQNELYRRMECLAPAAFIPHLRKRIVFKPWFHYEKDLIWIEHGNQYEYTTSFVNFLVPTLPFTYDETASAAARKPEQLPGNNTSPPPADEHIELDLSSFLVRYLTNPSEPVNPLADNIRPLTRYWEGMWREHPFFVLGTFKAGLYFMLTAFGKSARMRVKTGWSDRKRSLENDTCMERESDISGILLQDLQRIDNCKAEPTMAHGPFRVLWWFLKPAITAALWLAPLTIVISNITKWIPDPYPPDSAGWLERTGITLLQGAAVLVVGALIVGLRKLSRKFFNVRSRTKGQKARDIALQAAKSATMQPELPWTGNAQLDMRTMATYIATKLNVPFVTFGHTHYSDIYRISDNQWYFNTGTWMTILEPREQLFREARQLTFLEITSSAGKQPRAELLCWYPPQSQPRPVVVVDLEELDDNVENGVIGSVAKFFGRRAN